MNIKSLLLGSAAAFVAVSGARAADAVVMVEPEPMEYVRVCDTYGTGFFYIPGTETCLKLSGLVRMRINANDTSANNDIDLDTLNSTFGPGVFTTAAGASVTSTAVNGGANVPGVFARGFTDDDYNAFTTVRGRLNIDAREETELGTLRAFLRMEANNSGLTGQGAQDSSSFQMKQAYIQLGGLTAGLNDSLWTQDDGLFTDTDLPVGDLTQNQLSYTFAVAGFNATISAEDDGSGDFVPDVVGRIGYEGGFGSANLYAVYDEQQGNTISVAQFGTSATTSAFFALPNDFSQSFIADFTNDNVFNPAFVTLFNGDVNDADEGAFALKANVTLKDLIAEGSQFKIEGSYAFDPTIYAVPTIGSFSNSAIFTPTGGVPVIIDTFTGSSFALASEYQIGAGYQQKFGKLFVAASGVYGETFDLKSFGQSFTAAGVPNGIVETNFGSAEYYALAANVGYDITSNLNLLGEVTYREVDLPGALGDQDGLAGFLQLQRNF